MNFKSSGRYGGVADATNSASKGEAPSVNMTPLVDIVFLLLIFFMVSTTFTKESRLQLTLPEASVDSRVEDIPLLEIVIPANGNYRVNDLPLTNDQPATLKRAMAKILKDKSPLAVIITADAASTHERVVRAMDVAGQLGLQNISITTRQTGSSPN